MIRIKFGASKYDNYSNKVIEFESDYQCREILSNSYGFNTIVNSITRVEKQVKDLTLDEVKKLRYYGVGFGTENDNCYYLGFGDNEIAVQKPEDYVDITQIIKGENK